MNRFLMMAVGVVMLTADGYGAESDAAKNAQIDWPARAAMVKVGMTRAEVEKILPELQPPRGSRKAIYFGSKPVTDSWNANVYWVSPDWRVTIKYDFTGAPKPLTPTKLQESVGPANRVIAPVKTLKIPFPPKYDPKLFDPVLQEKISAIIKECALIRPGMTRADLLKVFTEEGGLFVPDRRSYVHRFCSYIKVDVEFSLTDPNQSTDFLDSERPTDIITKTSKPYLEWFRFD